MHFSPKGIAAWIALVLPLAAQELPAVADLAKQVHELAQQLAEARDAGGAEDRAKVKTLTQAIDALIAPLLADEAKEATVEHYVEASSPLLEPYPLAAVRVAEAGLKHFPDARFLYDHIGFAKTRLAADEKPCAQQLADFRAAEQAFRKALTLQPDTFHAHLGLFQALDHLGRYDEALQQLDVAAKTAGSEAPPLLPLWRGCLLLRARKPAEAMAALQAEALQAKVDADGELKRYVLVLLLRAAALGGDAAKVAAQTQALKAADDSPAATLEAADALLSIGKKADAMKLLANKPAAAKDGGDETETAQLAQSFAALEVVANATDFGAASPLRIPLGKALGHAFLTMLPDKSGKTKEVDLSGSPVMMGSLLRSAPAAPPKEWGNRLLLALCIEAMPAHKPSAEETKVAAAVKDVAKAEDLPAVLAAMNYAVGDPTEPCGLASLRCAEKLQGKPPAAKK
jgi:tetratricopeptide (TPR) repeat protein